MSTRYCHTPIRMKTGTRRTIKSASRQKPASSVRMPIVIWSICMEMFLTSIRSKANSASTSLVHRKQKCWTTWSTTWSLPLKTCRKIRTMWKKQENWPNGPLCISYPKSIWWQGNMQMPKMQLCKLSIPAISSWWQNVSVQRPTSRVTPSRTCSKNTTRTVLPAIKNRFGSCS